MRRLDPVWVALFFVLFAACVRVTPETVTKLDSFTVPAVFRLEVDTFNGSIDVTRADGNAMVVSATIRQPNDVAYTAALDGDTVRVTATAKRNYINPSPGASLVITAPVNAVLDLKTSNGHVTVTGVGTGGSLESSNGRMHLEEVGGAFTVHSSNGAIELTKVIGSFDASTSNGQVTFDGTLSAGTSSKFSTSNGGIAVTFGADASVRVDADTSNGNVSVARSLSNASVSKDHVVGTVGNGDANLVLRTSNGNIDIR